MFILIYLFSIVGVANLWRRRRVDHGRLLLLTVPFALLSALNLPAVSNVALGTLEWQFPPGQWPIDVRAIAVLGGTLAPPDRVGGRAELRQDTLYRCLHAAELYRRSKPCVVLVSGGKANPRSPGPPLAQPMRDLLLNLGVSGADVIVEGNSRTTFENAVECRKLLEARGIHRVALVTEAFHIMRSYKCFIKQGIDVIPSACHYQAPDSAWPTLLSDFLPKPGAGLECQLVFHEWVGTAWYWLLGRI